HAQWRPSMKPLATFLLASALVAGGASYSALAQSGSDRPAAKTQDPLDRITCRRFTRIGSLVDNYRVCKTNREWQREHDNARQLSTADTCRFRGESPASCGE